MVNAAPFDLRVGAGKIDIFENAESRCDGLERFLAFHAVPVDNQHLARFEVTHVSRADDVERTGFRRKDPGVVALAKNQWPDAVWVTHADQHVVRHADERVGAVNLLQSVGQTARYIRLMRARDKVHDHLGIG